jgi:hypothetical protein
MPKNIIPSLISIGKLVKYKFMVSIFICPLLKLNRRLAFKCVCLLQTTFKYLDATD